MGGARLGGFTGLPRAFWWFITDSSLANSLISVLRLNTISCFSISKSDGAMKTPDEECGMGGVSVLDW